MSKLVTEVTNKDLLDVVRRMAVLAEFGEPGIQHHLERIRGYCYVLARGMDFEMQDAEMLSYASMLHDIGEIGIPDVLLTKAGKLSPYEMEQLKRHPIIGAEILRGSQSVVLQMGETIALTHHERWDGSGYPYGIRGEEVPVPGRICSLADIFDALTTRRPYKNEIPVAEAYQLILDNSGVLFDPVLVQAFSENFDEIVRIRQMNI
jgi:putative two-component system response regulator